ncbi:MAG: VTT domain-containing protein [Acidobacteriota bacterium]|nr:VTT domain-containing protein [Acidobacteriota bacterium]
MGFLANLNKYLLVMGIPGLLVISLLDSAAIPLAGGPDAVIMLLSWQRPALTWLVVLSATIGSSLGCLILYGIGRKGGEKALSRVKPEKVEWINNKMRDYGIWAVIAAVMAPPPFPTKPVILAAGVLGTRKLPFLSGVFAGRLVRYSLLGYLGATFGDESAQILKSHYPTIALFLLGGILLVILTRILRSRLKRGNRIPMSQ